MFSVDPSVNAPDPGFIVTPAGSPDVLSRKPFDPFPEMVKASVVQPPFCRPVPSWTVTFTSDLLKQIV